MEPKTKAILLVTNNYLSKDILTPLFSSSKTFTILKAHTIQQAIEYIKNQIIYLIIIDDGLQKSNPPLFTQLLQIIISLALGNTTVIIVEQLTQNVFAKYIRTGFTYITDIGIAQKLIPAVINYSEEFKNQRPLALAIKYHGLTIYPECNYVCFKNCKIFLSVQHLEILLFLTKNDGICEIKDLQRYLELKFNNHISNTYISVNISRINSKFKTCTGLRIIKNRYGIGYKLTV